jgi:hypothetical protein
MSDLRTTGLPIGCQNCATMEQRVVELPERGRPAPNSLLFRSLTEPDRPRPDITLQSRAFDTCTETSASWNTILPLVDVCVSGSLRL